MAIEFYKEHGPLGYLANYSSHGFIKNGIYYKTVEHYYQSEKFSDDQIKKQIIDAETPKLASSIGRDRNNIRIKDFKSIKNKVMYEGILEKFRQNRDIAYSLIATGHEDIREATIDEYYWGIGQNRTGQNNIGKILECVRARIKLEIIEAIINECKLYDTIHIVISKSDIDSIVSAHILRNILRKLGIDVKVSYSLRFLESGELDINILEFYLHERIDYLTPNSKAILVNCEDFDGIPTQNVIAAIDNHFATGEVYNTISIGYASTALVLYDLFREGYNFTEQEKILIALASSPNVDCLNRVIKTSKKDILFTSYINDNKSKKMLRPSMCSPATLV